MPPGGRPGPGALVEALRYRDGVSDDVRTVLGLSFGLHDAAAALTIDGVVVAAVEQERLSRVKHDPAFPDLAADCCLAIAGLAPEDVDVVAYYEKPLEAAGRHMASRLSAGPRGLPALLLDTPRTIRDHLTVGHAIDRWFRDRRAVAPAVHYVEHHTSHAAAAFHPSPHPSAAVLTIDGVGEWATSTIGVGRGRDLRVERELRYPDSVGLLYSAFTAYCGFRVNSGEGELMGLAPFGTARFADLILEKIVQLDEDGSIRLDQRYFAYVGGRRTTNRRFERLFGGPPRRPDEALTARHADLAASMQVVLDEILLRMGRAANRLSGETALCMAGGVALNCVAAGRLLSDGPFEQIWIQPAAGDAGGALGAALHTWHGTLGNERVPTAPDGMSGAFLGPRFDRDEIERWLDAERIAYSTVEDDDERCAMVADRLAGGAVIGWFCGRLEFGPRALGHRSILADPRSPTVQRRINQIVKERASFRPFAPAVLADRAAAWFQTPPDAPYMNLVVPLRHDRRIAPALPAPSDFDVVVAQSRSEVPAVTHVDYSARIQTVRDEHNPSFARLLRAFDERTGCPLLLNTSFNARDEPIVCTPADAYSTFRRTELDLLVLEHCLVEGRA